MSLHASQPQTPPTLASRPLPRRVRDLLTIALKLASSELEVCLATAIKDLEQQLHQQLALPRDSEARKRLELAGEVVHRSRADLTLHFMNALEAELAKIK